MLKVSDYVAMMLSFLAMLAFYLIFTGNLSINLGISNSLDPLEMPQEFSVIKESNEEEPVYAVLCGGQQEGQQTEDAIWMLSNLKKEYALFSTVEEISQEQIESVGTIVVTADSWNEIGNPAILLDYAEKQGKTLIFTGILEEKEGESYNKTIGILKNRGTATIDGIMISEGILIQGMVYFDDLEMEVADITADARCRKLMIEKSKEDVEQRDLIPLLWEKRYGEGRFYVVNGDFLTKEKGMGIFTGILSQIEDIFVYPVVNAKANLLDSFPEFDNPYEEQIESLYSRNTGMFLRDILWPSIVKLGEPDGLVFSARLNRKVREQDEEDYEYLARLMEKRGCEIDDSFTEPEMQLPYVSKGHYRKEEEIFRMQSNVSGWGLSTHYLDISEVMGKNAENPEFEWSSYSLELSKLMNDLYKDADWLDAMTVSQALERYKRYLLAEPVITKGEDQITLETKDFHDECFYIIRTNKTVLPGAGYETERIGEDTYLIRSLQDKILIGLKEETE